MTRRPLIVVAASLLVASGCGLADDNGRAGAGDTGNPQNDASTDASPIFDSSMPPPETGLRADDSFQNAIGAETCYRPSGPVSCEMATCSALRACCVGSGSCCAAVSNPLDSAVDFGQCAGMGALSDCLTGNGIPATAFGPALPFVESDGAFAPGGGLSGEGGLFLGDPVELSVHRVIARGTFQQPTDCDDPCFESVGFGITTQTPNPALEPRPVAALVYSAQRDDVALLVGDQVVERWPFGAASVAWELELQPTGLLRVRQGDDIRLESNFAARDAGRLMVFGRTTNPSPTQRGARIVDVSVAVSLCDMPTTWQGRNAIEITSSGGSPWAVNIQSTPTVLVTEARTYLGVIVDGELHLGEQTGAYQFDFPSPDVPAIASEQLTQTSYVSGGIADPELIEADGQFELYFTATNDAGRRSVGRAISGDGVAFVLDAELVVDSENFGWEAAEQPTVVLHESGERVLIARITTAVGAALHVFRASPDQGFEHFEDGFLEELSQARGSDPLAFDRDTVSSPSLVIFNGAWQLFYEGRNATRSAVGQLVSDELVGWRQITTNDPVLHGSGAGFDQVGVGGADVVVTSSGLRLIYLGDNGATLTLGAVDRTATNRGMVQ